MIRVVNVRAVVHICAALPIIRCKINIHNLFSIACELCATRAQTLQAIEALLAVAAHMKLPVTLTNGLVKAVSNIVLGAVHVELPWTNKIRPVRVRAFPGVGCKVRHQDLASETPLDAAVKEVRIWNVGLAIERLRAVLVDEDLLVATAVAKRVDGEDAVGLVAADAFDGAAGAVSRGVRAFPGVGINVNMDRLTLRDNIKYIPMD